MARMARGEVFSPEEIAVAHLIARVVRRCFLLGYDVVTGKNYDHRKLWIEERLELLASAMGIDLLCFSILCNHFHLVLRSRPDVVETWDNSEVARRWLALCPPKRKARKPPSEPTQAELNSIRNDAKKLKQIRSRLSDISWWMRLLCQNIATRANREDEEVGKFFQGRFKAVRLLDEESLLACAAYVDLNPIRAALAETLESSDHTSVQRRVQAIEQATEEELESRVSADRMLSPVAVDPVRDPLGAQPSTSPHRCSDKGFLDMSSVEYLQLLDWTARRVVPGKPGATSEPTPPLLARLSLKAEVWCELVSQFGELFHIVAGLPQTVDKTRSLVRRQRYYLRRQARELLTL